MIFASQIFLFWFLPLVLGVYYAAPARARSLVLVFASYFFYGWWRLDFTLLMVVSTVIDYYCGRGISRANAALPDAEADAAATASLNRRRKRLLLCSICANLGLLGYFKYMNFGVESLNAILAWAGMEGVTWPAVVLPVGISFYTFQTMSYTIDVYRKEALPVRRFIDFACYVALFPQLVAGPIVRYRSLADQLVKRSHTFCKFSDGALLFQAGFIKKILLADIAARVADAAFTLSAPSCLEAWLGTTAYAFQIYFDFSGYSDMAIGLGLMFGFRFPINFDSPYKSQSITEFWRRWHISLSSWLRDYLYIPAATSRVGARNMTHPALTRSMVPATASGRGSLRFASRSRLRRSATSSRPCQAPQMMKVREAPCHRPPRTMTAARLTYVRACPRLLPPSGM
ncbi:MAG: MBOAT family O-acyltransferase [Planctomycetota bacterium]